MKTALHLVGVASIGALFLLPSCAHHEEGVDVSVVESRIGEITLVPPPRRVIMWDASGEIPNEKMVWIEIFNGEPRIPKSKEPIRDVCAYIDETAERLGEVWVIIQQIHWKMQPFEKDQEVIDACARSRARAVVLRDVVYLGGRLRDVPDIPPKRWPKIPSEYKKTDDQKAQPGATDNPDDAQHLREDH